MNSKLVRIKIMKKLHLPPSINNEEDMESPLLEQKPERGHKRKLGTKQSIRHGIGVDPRTKSKLSNY
jgi:hypothetical protein